MRPFFFVFLYVRMECNRHGLFIRVGLQKKAASV